MVSIVREMLSNSSCSLSYPQLLLFAETIHILLVVHGCTFVFGLMLFDDGRSNSLAIGSRDYGLAAIRSHFERIARDAARHWLGRHVVKNLKSLIRGVQEVET